MLQYDVLTMNVCMKALSGNGIYNRFFFTEIFQSIFGETFWLFQLY